MIIDNLIFIELRITTFTLDISGFRLSINGRPTFTESICSRLRSPLASTFNKLQTVGLNQILASAGHSHTQRACHLSLPPTQSASIILTFILARWYLKLPWPVTNAIIQFKVLILYMSTNRALHLLKFNKFTHYRTHARIKPLPSAVSIWSAACWVHAEFFNCLLNKKTL